MTVRSLLNDPPRLVEAMEVDVVEEVNLLYVGLTRAIPGDQGSTVHLLTASDWKDASTYKQEPYRRIISEPVSQYE